MGTSEPAALQKPLPATRLLRRLPGYLTSFLVKKCFPFSLSATSSSDHCQRTNEKNDKQNKRINIVRTHMQLISQIRDICRRCGNNFHWSKEVHIKINLGRCPRGCDDGCQHRWWSHRAVAHEKHGGRGIWWLAHRQLDGTGNQGGGGLWHHSPWGC